MVVVLIESFVKPEKREGFIEFLTQHAKACIDEPGCVRFDLLEKAEEPNTFYYYEVYKDDEARAAHRETPHLKRYIENIEEYLATPSVVHRVNCIFPQ